MKNREYIKPRKNCENCIHKCHNVHGETLEIVSYCKIFHRFKTKCNRKFEIRSQENADNKDQSSS